jgi:hypothetical protein
MRHAPLTVTRVTCVTKASLAGKCPRKIPPTMDNHQPPTATHMTEHIVACTRVCGLRCRDITSPWVAASTADERNALCKVLASCECNDARSGNHRAFSVARAVCVGGRRVEELCDRVRFVEFHLPTAHGNVPRSARGNPLKVHQRPLRSSPSSAPSAGVFASV